MELVESCNNDATTQMAAAAKGKRTKRQRPLSPCAVSATVMTTTSSCSSEASRDQVSGGADYYGSFSSTTTTTTFDDQEEEEDMANCLILLAQGVGGGGGGAGGGRDSRHGHHHQDHDPGVGNTNNNNKATEKGSSSSSSRRFAEMTATATATKIGFYVYECKTCNRTFPSFQALGGHRASHKRPKMTLTPEKKKPPSPPPPPQQPAPLPPPPPPPSTSSPPQLININYEFEEAAGQPRVKSGPPISLQLGCSSNKAFHGNKSKIHECSICGSEFASGQALGGHMRRHRSSTSTSTQAPGMASGIETSCDPAAAAAAVTAAVAVKPRNILELDLNLPAPEDDLRDSKFQFTTATQKSLVLSAAPALVGCHY